MASLYGTDPSYDYSHMYNIKDLRGELPKPVLKPGTILYALHQHGSCSKFIELVSKAGLAGVFNDKQANFTVFAPIDDSIDCMWLKSVSSFKAKQYVLYHTLDHAVAPSFLRSSKAMYLNTRIPGSRLFVENYNEVPPLINRISRVIECPIVLDSSVVYVVDRVLHIDGNPLSNIDI